MNYNKLRKKIKNYRVVFWSLFGISLGTTILGFLILKLLNNNFCYNILGFGGGITTFLLLFAFISTCLTLNSYNVKGNSIVVYASFKTRIIIVNDKVYKEYHRFFFPKTLQDTFLLGPKRVEVFISMSNEVSVKVNGSFIPKINK